LLERLVAVVRKTRVSGAAVRAEQLADAIGRLHRDQPLGDLLART